MFYWQYRGGVKCKLAINDSEILGFLGAIPGKYLLCNDIISGVSLAIWVVAEKYRNSGLGIFLLDAVEQENDCVICLGVNKNVVKFYQMRNYAYLDKLRRYIISLDANLSKMLIGDAWKIDFSGVDELKPTNISAEMAFRLWQQFSAISDASHENKIKFTLYRNKEFWDWRYINSAGFEYLFFSDYENANFLVGRFDEISGATTAELNDKRVFRVIELLSSDYNFIKRVLLWAKNQNAILADFQISSTLFDKVLLAAGFKTNKELSPKTQIPAIFSPIRYDIPPINLVMKLPDKLNCQIGFDETYFVKSDGDMDRPIR